MVRYGTDWKDVWNKLNNWKVKHISPVLAARKYQLTFSSSVFHKSYYNYIPSGSWYIWHLENIDLHCCNPKHMDSSDQPEVWLLWSFIWLLFYCTINATARSDGSCFIELEIRSSLGEMTSKNQEWRLFSQGFQCCFPSLCFYSRYGGQSSATVCSERVWGHIWWCHRQYESLTNWSQMP